MLTTIFANIEIFYLLVWIVTAGFCVAARDRDYTVMWILLGFMFYFGQFPMWRDPTALLWGHVAILLIMVGAFRDTKYPKILRLIMLIMVITDSIWTRIDGGLFIYQSILNLLYLALCAITIVGCWYHRKDNPQRRRDLKKREEYNLSAFTPVDFPVDELAERRRSG